MVLQALRSGIMQANKIKINPFDRLLIKIFHWEYWPFNLVYFPIIFYYAWLSIKSRNFLFFSTSNPGIEFSGMLGESKIDIYKKIDNKHIPKTVLCDLKDTQKVIEFMDEHDFHFPVIMKPNRGERGWMVNLIRNEQHLIDYLKIIKVNYLIQDFIDWSLETAVFYYRHPSKEVGVISSIAKKIFFCVVGDGKSSIAELIIAQKRGKVFYKEYFKRCPKNLSTILKKGEKLQISEIGTHSKGTKFVDANHLICDKLTKKIDQVAQSIDGFYFGRFDLKSKNEDALLKGEFKIIELNGAGAEPAHIYDPKKSLLDAYKDIIFHLNKMYEISRYNRRQGVDYMSYSEYKKMKGIVSNIKKLKREKT